MYGADKQRIIVNLTIWGFVAIIAAVIGFMMFGGIGSLFLGIRTGAMLAGFCILVGLIGAGMLVAAMVYALRQSAGSHADRPVERHENAYIISCQILNDRHEPIFDPDMYDEDEYKCFVQVELANGRKVEYETTRAVMGTIGEGMRGTITVQGNWLGQFEMTRPPGWVTGQPN